MTATVLLIADQSSTQVYVSCVAVGWRVVFQPFEAYSLIDAIKAGADLVIVVGQGGVNPLQVYSSLRSVADFQTASVLTIVGPGDRLLAEALLESGVDECWLGIGQVRNLLLRLNLFRFGALDRNYGDKARLGLSESGGTRLNSGYVVRANGLRVELNPMQLKVLRHLIDNPNVFHSTQALQSLVRRDFISDLEWATCLRKLRRVLAITGHDATIRAVRSTGYVFVTQANPKGSSDPAVC